MNLSLNQKPPIQVWLPLSILLLFLLVSLALAANSKFLFRYKVPTGLLTSDRGFRYDLQAQACLDGAGKRGRSSNFLGPCGDVEGVKLSHAKLLEHTLIAATVNRSTIQDFHGEFISAQGSNWENSEIRSSRILGSDFHLSQWRNVVFERVQLTGVAFTRARFVNVVFRDSVLDDVNFFASKLENVRFERTKCRRCAFADVDMESTHIDGAFESATFNLNTKLPFVVNEAGKYGFQFSL